MAGVEVAGCAAAVVSAFHGGADLVRTLREKNDKKKRRKERDIEQAHEEKMLHKSLIDGARQVQLACVDRRQRFGRAFDVGDPTATSELKDIMISMQTEVISALQFVRMVENAPLECAPLYEAVVRNKTSAIRTMDELCRRIVMSMPAQRQYQDERQPSAVYAPQRDEDFSPASHYRVAREPDIRYRMTPTHYGNSSRLPTRSLMQAQPVRQSYESPLQRMTSTVTTAAAYPPSRERRREQTTLSDEIEEQDEIIGSSIHDSAIGSIEPVVHHQPNASVTSTILSDETARSNESGESGAKRDDLRIVQTTTDRRFSFNSDGSTAAYQSGTSTPAQFAAQMLQTLSYADEDHEASLRANSAPEVVTREFESLMLSSSTNPHQHSTTGTSHFLPLSVRNTHPALRPDSTYTDVFAPEPDRLWTPLHRPAKHNNYNNFCKGAWETRQSVLSGLAIALIPNHKNQAVAHWKCKHCDFRSRGMNNSQVLPDQVYFSTQGVRYRWLFLAKSHVYANEPHAKPDMYRYGCVFCAAQGRLTAVHAGLEKLMEHIVGKHKTDMLTPEVLGKTRCIVGGAPSRSEDWDINVPNSSRRIVKNDVKDFVVSAVTGIL